jgi:hypothetical protein
MSLIHSPFRIGATITFLILALTFPAPLIAQIRDQMSKSDIEALIQLMNFAKKQYVALQKQGQIANAQMRLAGMKAQDAHNKGSVEEARQYKLIQYAWSGLNNAINSKGLALEKMFAWERASPPPTPLQLYSSAVQLGHGYLYNRPGYIGLLNERETSAKVRFEVAKYKSEGKERVALIQLELGLYQQTRTMRDQEWAVIDKYLAVTQAPSMSELERKPQARQQARRESQQDAEKEIQRANEYVKGLVLALGVVAAAQIILNSPTSPVKGDQGREMLKSNARTDCISRGGIFLDGGELSIGTCTK